LTHYKVTRHRTKTNKAKKKNTIQKTQKMSNRKMLDITIHKHTQKIIRQEPSYKQLEVKTNRTSFLCGNRIGHHSYGTVHVKRHH